jgi:hypothetical protein
VRRGQADWNDDPDADGVNDTVTEFAFTARVLFERFGDRIKRWELWNEPDCWKTRTMRQSRSSGCTYLLPRVYAKILAETWSPAPT